MDEEFLRFVGPSAARDYPGDGTDAEKLASDFIARLRKKPNISIFKVTGEITEVRIAAANAATKDHLNSIH